MFSRPKIIENIDVFKTLMNNEPHYNNPVLPHSQEYDFKKLYDYFNNKSVAIVGPSPQLLNQGKGDEIDNYDIVCKLGNMYNVNIPKDYGHKIDVLFCGCFPESDLIENLQNKNIKILINPLKTCIPGILDVHKRDIYGHYIKLQKKLQNIEFYSAGILSCEFDYITQTRATLGTFSINLLLQQNLKKLGIYGITWFSESNTIHAPGYYNENDEHFNCKNMTSPHGYSLEIEKNMLKNIIKISEFEIYLNDEVKKNL